jgi:dTDP-4-dehydrorhamnose reductase
MRIAITGHKGQLGQALRETLKDDEVLGLDLPEHDITQADEISDAIAGYKPQVVIHTAALTDVDRCAREPELALRINGLGTHNVALACQRCDAALLAMSTNEVFDGLKGKPQREQLSAQDRASGRQTRQAARGL